MVHEWKSAPSVYRHHFFSSAISGLVQCVNGEEVNAVKPVLFSGSATGHTEYRMPLTLSIPRTGSSRD